MKFIKGYCPHCTTKVLMKSTAERLTCPHCGKEYTTEEAKKLYISIKQEKQSREEEEIKEKSISYVNDTYEKETNTNEGGYEFGRVTIMIMTIIPILLMIVLSMFHPGKNDKSDLSETMRQETKARIEQTEPVTVPETEAVVEETYSEIAETDNATYDNDKNNAVETDSGSNYDMDSAVDDINMELMKAINSFMGIFRLLGTVILIYAIALLVLAFANEDADSKSRALMMIIAAIMMMTIPTVFSAMAIA